MSSFLCYCRWRPRLHRRPSSSLSTGPHFYGWLIISLLLDVYVFTTGLLSSANDWCLCHSCWPPYLTPIGFFVSTVGVLCHRCWWRHRLHHWPPPPLPTSVFAYTVGDSAAVDGHIPFHRRRHRLVFLSIRLGSTPPPLMGLVIFTTGLLPSPPIDIFVAIDEWFCSHIGHLCYHQGKYQKVKSSLIFFLIWYFSFPLPHYINRFSIE